MEDSIIVSETLGKKIYKLYYVNSKHAIFYISTSKCTFLSYSSLLICFQYDTPNFD